MSGTSIDGVDAVLAEFTSSKTNSIASFYYPYKPELRSRILALQNSQPNDLHLAQLLGNELAGLYAEAVSGLIKTAHISREQITAIGCHGQTVRHCPDEGYTLQLGNAALLAEKTNITVVADFRSRDIAGGGQGAPLVPAFHDVLFRHPSIHRVIVNIGGISNLTNLSLTDKTIGFDCGPGNMLMDAWCQKHIGELYDKEGEWALSGMVLPQLLKKLLDTPFFQISPPKSTGRELFNLDWLTKFLSLDDKPSDVQATLLALTVASISQAIVSYCKGADEVYLCGGGARNRGLVTKLQEKLKNIHVTTTDELGVSADYLEAHAFAWLAYQTMHHLPISLSEVTGAKGDRILGAVHYVR